MKGNKQPRLSHKFAALHHSHKKRKDWLEARVECLVFWLELEISGVAIQKIDQNSEKTACSEGFIFSFSFFILVAREQRLFRQYSHSTSITQ